jgi:hypothetical protein
MAQGAGAVGGMLCGGGDSLVDHLLKSAGVEELSTEVLEESQRPGGHGQAPPATRGPIQYRPHQRQAARLARQPTDHLDAAAGLAEGPLDEVGVADAPPVLTWEAQMHRQAGQVVGDAGDGGRVAALPLGGERLGLPLAMTTATSPGSTPSPGSKIAQ